MTILFSWRRIKLQAGNSSNRVVQILRAMLMQQSGILPKNFRDPLYNYYQKDYSGNSYLLNLHELLDKYYKWTSKEIAEYVALASLRNYSDYTVLKYKHLDLIKSPIPLKKLNNNRLLRVQDKKIYFLYEEAPKRRIELWH